MRSEQGSSEPNNSLDGNLLPTNEGDGQQVAKQQLEPGTVAALQAVALTYSGPLPHPAMLRQYEEILPGSAERIFSVFERQSESRQALEKRAIFADATSQVIGTISASVMGIGGVFGGVWLAHEGKDLSGLTTVIGTLASLVGLFLWQRSKQDKERAEKRG